MFMNEAEIDHAVYQIERRAPQLLPYAKYLSDWKDVINANSDGWPYWSVGTKAAEGLMQKVTRIVDCLRDGRHDDLPTVQDLKDTLTPIKSAATRHKLQAPILAEVQEVLDLPEAKLEDAKYACNEGWTHFFTDPSTGKDREYNTRFVVEIATAKVVDAQILWNANGEYEAATSAEIADLEDSLIGTNDILADPEQWDLELTEELPEWAVPVSEIAPRI